VVADAYMIFHISFSELIEVKQISSAHSRSCCQNHY